ncbi:MAG: hypothetical protein E7159_05955 [Firmicutes bacterium]|jgi:archaellin|nr:hypothetical protein [Bacillota bacterium]
MKRLRKYLIVLIILVTPLFLYGTYTFAKYVTEKFFSYYTNSKNFYFTSNILKEDNPLYQINNWVGIGQFTINFDLLSSKNEYVHTDYDITYEASVTCPSDVICDLDKPTGTIHATTHSDTLQITVAPQRLYTEGQKITIQIRAKTTSPYVKELYAKYEYVVGKTGVTYEIEDNANSPYLLLKITNAINYCTVIQAFGEHNLRDAIDVDNYMQLSQTDKAKCVSQYANFGFDPNMLLLDTTSEVIKKATYGTSNVNGRNYVNYMRFPLDPLSSVAIKFYKNNPSENYTYPGVYSWSVIWINFQEP